MAKFNVLNKKQVEARIGVIYPKEASVNYNTDNATVKLFCYKKRFTDERVLEDTVGFDGFSIEPLFNNGEIGSLITVGERKAYGFANSSDACEKNPTAIAGFSLGIGTELYTAPEIIFWGRECKNISVKDGRIKCYDNFVITEFEATEIDGEKTIVKLTIENTSSGVIKKWVAADGVKGTEPVIISSSTSSSKKPTASKEEKPKAERKASAKQVKFIKDLLGESTDALLDYGVNEIKELTSKQASELIEKLSNANIAKDPATAQQNAPSEEAVDVVSSETTPVVKESESVSEPLTKTNTERTTEEDEEDEVIPEMSDYAFLTDSF